MPTSAIIYDAYTSIIKRKKKKNSIKNDTYQITHLIEYVIWSMRAVCLKIKTRILSTFLGQNCVFS